jgi:hypothetical protein
VRASPHDGRLEIVGAELLQLSLHEVIDERRSDLRYRAVNG